MEVVPGKVGVHLCEAVGSIYAELSGLSHSREALRGAAAAARVKGYLLALGGLLLFVGSHAQLGQEVREL